MKLKTMLVAVLTLALFATAVLAATPKPVERMDLETFMQMNRLHGPAFTGRAVFEGFEGLALPDGWDQFITFADKTWTFGTANVDEPSVEGVAAAYVAWDTYTGHNEAISFDQLVDVAGGESVLSFWMAGTRGQSWDFNVAETVEINGVPVFDFDTDTQLIGYMEWEQFFVDLGAYDGTTVTITFRYEGIDGDFHALDAVMVDDGTGWSPPPPPPPPTNDTCEGVIDLQEQGLDVFDVDLCLASDAFSPGEYPDTCTGYGATGFDVVYSIELAAGETFMVTEDGPHDMAMYLVTDCQNPAGTCVAGSDLCCSGATELINFMAPTAGVYYLIVDGYSGCGLVTVTINAPIANEDMQWGSVKSLFR